MTSSQSYPEGYHTRRIALGFMGSQVIRAAVRLGVADVFDDGPREVPDVAEALGLPQGPTRRLLRALAALSFLVEERADRFAPTDEGRLLSRSHPRSISAFVDMFTDPMMTDAWSHLADGVRTGATTFETVFGKPFFEVLAEDEEKSALFNASMSEATRLVAELLPGEYDFGRFGSVVDIGGGDGTLLMPVLAANPGLRAAVYDLAQGCEAAAARFAEAGFGDRTTVLNGDMFAGVPSGFELYMIKSVIHDWDDDRCAHILDHCRGVIPDEGRLLLIEPPLPEVVDPDGWPGLYFSDLNMLVNVGGRERTVAEFDAMFRRSGFEPTEARPIGRPGGFWTLEARPV